MSSLPECNTKINQDWRQILTDKVVFVTGGGGGIGSVICQTCLLQGAKVVVADINKIAADQVLEKLHQNNDQQIDRIISLELDVTNEKGVEQAIEIVINKWGTIDVLINTAAIFVFGEIENISSDAWKRNFDVNVHGFALLVKYIVPIMKKQRSGSIIQFGSISGVIAQPTFLPYGAGKAAVIQMTRSLALELGPYNIRCNSVSPGLIVTPPVIATATSYGLSIEEFSKAIVKDQCLKRSGDPQEIANLVVFLASDLCPFITGANLIADGGYTTV
ncbi:unnamed protein product [Adineta steineri]|uniref:Uncharacterized protein n=1 Tax=Adineta steineri TaxID=433720 RepID=A0A819G944_9BILA|nr:unnamed protein product [Adineta steineri]